MALTPSGGLFLGTYTQGTSTDPGAGYLTVTGKAAVGTTNSPLTTLSAVETGSSTPRGISSYQYSTDTNSARIGSLKARGTEISPTTIVTGDVLGHHSFWGYEGTNWLEMGSVSVQSTGTIGTNRIPTKMIFQTATDASPSVKTAALTLNADQSATFAGTVTTPGGTINTAAYQAASYFAPAAGSSFIIGVGTVTTGTWNASVLSPIYGGTGSVNGSANTIVFSGNYSLGITLTGTTAVTFPLSGMLAVAVTSGSVELNTTTVAASGVIASGACQALATHQTATGVTTSDVIDWSFSGDPTGKTGFTPSANGMLTLILYCDSSGYIQIKTCNNTAASITLNTSGNGATVNWRVRR